MKELVTKDSLREMLDEEKYGREYVEKVIGQALVAMLKRQTRDEQEQNTTNTENGVGFTGADAHGASITAKYFIKWKTLGGLDRKHKWRGDKWLEVKGNGYPRLCKYAKQLNEIAIEKAARLAAVQARDAKVNRQPWDTGP